MVQTQPTAARYLSLDVLRGLTVCLMIVVNTPGSWSQIYAPFKHAAWHGFTVTDLVFPTFLFVVGNALSFGMHKLKAAGDAAFLKKVFKRAGLIFLIGFLLGYFPFVKWEEGDLVAKNVFELRIWGVLQRIAVCYLLGALLVYYFNRFSVIIISMALLLIYWFLLHVFGNMTDPYSLEGNVVKQLDLWLLPAKNLYQGFGIPFEPEGLLSTIPAVVNVTFGYLAGWYIQENSHKAKTAIKLLVTGIILLFLALLWDSVFPINKPIWTSSYVLYTVGWDLLLLAFLIYIIEVINFQKWTYFFEVFGRNPLFIYVLSGLFIKLLHLIKIDDISLSKLAFEHLFMPWLSDKNASLAFAIVYTLLLWLIGYALDKKKIYVKV
jgi:predicted acyltransferase